MTLYYLKTKFYCLYSSMQDIDILNRYNHKMLLFLYQIIFFYTHHQAILQ